MFRRFALTAALLAPAATSAQAPGAAPPPAAAPPAAAPQAQQQAAPRGSLVTERSIAAALAAEAAAAAVEACAGRGWRVAAAVVDRSGVLKALLRGDGAAPHTVDSARGKAYTAATLRNTTSALQETVRTNPGASQLPAIPGLLILGGGIPIRVGEEVVGAIGVGGAPGGNFDDQCAEAGIARIRDRLP
ncbi:GlcG/HbpS family heme-binding protein [Caldovatus aquaticus]|uniref:Heme-binding protein n=1 Tax=Caldovatus aquaticus TaxID=2865671 RepID=A0ABS7EZ61_9PROT|nr:heme-binding protein [Caldovatus aquaticus]MBW8268650.1 heme-binding protein [Caldovatus aquaticus]